jgi:type IV pilus assembly protein PilX
MKLQSHSTSQKQRGVALIASLIIMLLITIVALSIMRGNNLFEKMAGNTRERQRALQSAQSALQYAETWIATTAVSAPSSLTAGTCSTTAALTTMQVCNVDPTSSSSGIANIQYFPYQIPGICVAPANSPGGVITSGATCKNTAVTPNVGDVYYAQDPGVNIYLVGTMKSTGQLVFKVTAIGYGGSTGTNATVAIVQSLYALGSSGGSGGGTGGSGLDGA